MMHFTNHTIRLCGAAVVLLAAMGGPVSGQREPATMKAALVSRYGATESRSLITRAYDIADLCADSSVQDLNAPESGRALDQIAREMGQLVADTIEPASWTQRPGEIEWHLVPGKQQLVATQTEANHAAIARLFAQLRKGHAVQVTVETRFITTNATVPIAAQKEPVRDTGEMPPNAPILDEAQCRALIAASVANKNSSLVSAPRVTIANGQEALVQVETLTSYVAAIVPKKNREGQMEYEPVVVQAPDGVSFKVRAAVMADGKSVGLQISSIVNRLAGLEMFTFMESPLRLTVQQTRKQEYSAELCCVVPDKQTLVIGPLPVSEFPSTRPTTRSATTSPALGQIPIVNRMLLPKSTPQQMYILVKPIIIGGSTTK